MSENPFKNTKARHAVGMLTLVEMAQMSNVSKKRMTRYLDQGLLPQPDLVSGPRALWKIESYRTLEANLLAHPEGVEIKRDKRFKSFDEKLSLTVQQISNLQLANRFYRCLAEARA
jgi:hypothetical protein